MKTRILTIIITLLLGPALAQADHRGRGGSVGYAEVTHVEPVYEEVGYEHPHEHCWDETLAHEERGSATAPILGAIIGGAIGHQFGHGSSNKKVGAFVGAGLGAAIASDANRHRDQHYRVVRRCETVREVKWKKEVVGYDVTYRYHGREYHTRLPYDPGERLKVNVAVTPAS